MVSELARAWQQPADVAADLLGENFNSLMNSIAQP
jgi:hypothetical protein